VTRLRPLRSGRGGLLSGRRRRARGLLFGVIASARILGRLKGGDQNVPMR
jgi:hypothetical protein